MYGYENYQRVKETVAERRRRAIADADARNLAHREENEDIRLIDRELVSTGLRLFKEACIGGDVEKIKQRNISLMKRRGEVLRSLGLPEDYTEPRFTCATCADTGFVGSRMCTCFRELLLKENIKSSGIGSLIERQSFANFSVKDENPEIAKSLRRNKREAERFVKEFSTGAGGKNLVLLGKTGTGKTHISTAIAKELIEAGYEVLYDSAENILQAFVNDRFSDRVRSHEPESAKYLECDLLIIDDLGSEFINNLTVSCLYNLLNTRLIRGLSTVISTNLAPTDIQSHYDDRIYSRLLGSDSTVLMFEGRDKRIFK